MKKSLILGIILSAICIAPALAKVTVEEQTDPEYIINSGYSQVVAEDVYMQKNRVAGKPIEPLYERTQGKFARAFKRVFGYVDPSYDEYDRLHHDFHPSPSFSDL